MKNPTLKLHIWPFLLDGTDQISSQHLQNIDIEPVSRRLISYVVFIGDTLICSIIIIKKYVISIIKITYLRIVIGVHRLSFWHRMNKQHTPLVQEKDEHNFTGRLGHPGFDGWWRC